MVILKWFFYLAIVFAIAVLLLFSYKGHESRSGGIPGLLQGVLQPCPDKPNCVRSEAGTGENHKIEAIQLPANVPMEAIRSAIELQGGVVLQSDEFYLAATFTSAVFGFVDDLEIRRQGTDGVFHVRSASRVGHSDLGTNRQRVESLITAFQSLK